MVFFALLLLFVSFSFSVEIFSDILERLPTGEIVAKGNVEGFYKNYYIKTDTLRYNPETKDVYAEGNVYIRSLDGKLEVVAKEAWLNLDSDYGYFIDVNGRFERFYFQAEKVDKEKDTYKVEQGNITTCPPDKKELKLCFSGAKITDKYVFSYNNNLRFFEVPFAYLPISVYPVGERRSGLLPPLIGSNVYNSFIYQQPIYWAISQDKDATITLDYRTAQAKGLGLEYRQAIRKSNDLKLNFSFYKEPKPQGNWWEGRDLTTFRENRYRIKLDVDFDNLKAGVDTISDPYFMQDIYFRTEQRTVPYLTSYLSYIRDSDKFMFTFDLSKFYDTTAPNNRQTLNRLPEMNLYFKDTKILGNLYASAHFGFANFYRQEGLKAKRLLFFPQLQYPLYLAGLTFLSTLTYEGIYYLDLNKPYEKKVSTFSFSESLPISWHNTIKDWNISHFLEIGYEYRPRGFENPRFDPLDEVDKHSVVKASYRGYAMYENVQIFNIFVEGGIDHANNAKYQGKVLSGRLLPVRFIFGFNPTQPISFHTEGIYDPNDSTLLLSSNSTSIKYKNSSLNLGYILSKSVDKQVITDQYSYGFASSYEGITFGFNIVHDNKSKKDIYRQLSADYRGGCWNLGFLFKDTYNGEAKKYIKEFFLVINIFDLQRLTLPLKRQ